MHARVLLQKQDELAEIEQRLNELDDNDVTAFFLNSRRLDGNDTRQALLDELAPKLKEYGKPSFFCTLSLTLTACRLHAANLSATG